MAFKKRRRPKTVNKNDERVRRMEASNSRPPLSALYPQVQRLSIRLDFYSPEGSLLGQETRDFGPSDRVDFGVPCQGRCSEGQMDLAGKLDSTIKRRETLSTSQARCGQTLYADSNDLCGTELRCHITVSYYPEPEAESTPL